jgi:hypothetical protein
MFYKVNIMLVWMPEGSFFFKWGTIRTFGANGGFVVGMAVFCRKKCFLCIGTVKW